VQPSAAAQLLQPSVAAHLQQVPESAQLVQPSAVVEQHWLHWQHVPESAHLQQVQSALVAQLQEELPTRKAWLEED